MKHLNSNLVVGFAGRARVGKNTCAEYLAKWLYLAGIKEADEPKYLAYASCLKNAICDTFKINLDQLNKAKITPLGRWILEQVGTNYFDRNDIMSHMAHQIADIKDGHHVILITDVRHVDEANFIRDQLGGIVIRVRHEPTDSVESVNVSEREIESVPYDLVIHNDHGLQHLDCICKDIANQIMYQHHKTTKRIED